MTQPAKYLQVYKALLEMSGRLPADAQLPTERELCGMFSVSRSTVRRALHDLEMEQRVYRHQGRGTFVAAPKIDQLLELTSHTEDMHAHGVTPGSKLVDVSRIGADAEVAPKLEIELGSEVLRIERLRLADGEPIAIEVLYVDAGRFDDLMSDLDEGSSFYQLLSRQYGVDVASAEESIEAVAAGEREADLLRTVVGAPILMLGRSTLDTDGRPVEYVRSFYRGDRFRFLAHLERHPATGRGSGPTFRLGQQSDAPELAKLFVAAWKGGYRGIVPDSVTDALDVGQITDLLRVNLAIPRQLAIVAVDEAGTIAGFTRVGDDPDDARRGQIFSLYVAPGAAGGGIGRKLLELGLEALDKRDQHDVTLWVFSGNERARHLYESFGFAPDGTLRVEAQFKTEEIRMVRPGLAVDRASVAGPSARNGSRSA